MSKPAFATVLLALAMVPAAAQDLHRTWFEPGATDARWRFTNTDSPPLQAEEELGLPRRQVLQGLAFGRRIGERWRIEFDYGRARRAGSTTLTRDVQIGEDQFIAGTRLSSTQELQTLRVMGGWSWLQQPGHEFGLAIGGQWVRLDQRHEGTGVAAPPAPPPQPAPAPGPRVRDDSDVVPVGLFGLFGRWSPHPAWQLTGRFDIGTTDRLRDLRLQAWWRPTQHLALGLGWQHTAAELDVVFGFIGCCTQVAADYRIQGPTLAARVSF